MNNHSSKKHAKKVYVPVNSKHLDYNFQALGFFISSTWNFAKHYKLFPNTTQNHRVAGQMIR